MNRFDDIAFGGWRHPYLMGATDEIVNYPVGGGYPAVIVVRDGEDIVWPSGYFYGGGKYLVTLVAFDAENEEFCRVGVQVLPSTLSRKHDRTLFRVSVEPTSAAYAEAMAKYFTDWKQPGDEPWFSKVTADRYFAMADAYVGILMLGVMKSYWSQWNHPRDLLSLRAKMLGVRDVNCGWTPNMLARAIWEAQECKRRDMSHNSASINTFRRIWEGLGHKRRGLSKLNG